VKIAICDDESDDLKCIHQYLNVLTPTAEIVEFSSGSSLLSAFKRDFFDLIFMDIEMPQPNGYEVSAQLMSQNLKPLIIFTTKTSEYSVQGYGIAFRYLLKPVTLESLTRALDAAIDIIAPQKIAFNINGTRKVFSVDNISFFEIMDHNITLHTNHSAYTFRGSLSDIMDFLALSHFAQSHKSYFVNLSFVDRISIDQIVLTSGDVVGLSRDKKKEFIQKLGKYLKGER